MRPLLSHGVDPVAPSGSVADPVLKSRPQGNSGGCMSDQSIQLTFQNKADQWAYPSMQTMCRVRRSNAWNGAPETAPRRFCQLEFLYVRQLPGTADSQRVAN